MIDTRAFSCVCRAALLAGMSLCLMSMPLADVEPGGDTGAGAPTVPGADVGATLGAAGSQGADAATSPGADMAGSPGADATASPAADAGATTGAAPAAAPAPSAPAFPALDGILADYRALRVGSAYDAAGREFTVGHLRLTFRTGTLTAILTGSGRETGFIFDGDGYYSYTTEDPGDRQSIGKNILKFVNTTAYKDGTLGEEMKGCVFIASQPVLSEILGPGAPAGGAAPGGAASRLVSFVSEADDADIGLDHPAALAALASPPGRMVYGEIDGKVVDPGYMYDPVVLREEDLLLYRSIGGNRFSATVSRQPIAGGRKSSPIVLTRLGYSMDTDNNRDATVKIEGTFSVDEPLGRVVPFYMFNHVDSAATRWSGSSKRSIEVRGVKTGDGKALPFSHRYHELLVELPETPAAGSTLTLHFDLLLHSLDTRGDEYYALQAVSGFPRLAWLSSVNATSHWKIRTKKPYRAFTGGTILARREDGDSMFLESEVDVPTDEPFMIAGKFTSKEFERNGVKVRVNIYGSGSGRAFDTYRETAFTLLDVYGKALVPYPRKELDIMELKVTYSYRSTPGLLLCSAEPAMGGMVDASTHDNRYMQQLFGSPTITGSGGDGSDIIGTQTAAGGGSGVGASVLESRKGDVQMRAFMHELAHQWFGNLVRRRNVFEDRWIAESIAEYLSALVYGAGAKDEKEKARKMDEAYKQWWLDTDMTKDSVSIAHASYLRGGWTTGFETYQILYGRGPLVVRMLHTMMGEDKFFELLQGVTTKYAGKAIGTDDFAKEASAVAGRDMTWFFKQWIGEPGIPDLEVSKSIVREGGKAYLSGHLKQRDPAHFKVLLLPFVLEAGRTRSVKLVVMDKPEMDFKVEIPADTSNAVLDPARNNLVYYH